MSRLNFLLILVLSVSACAEKIPADVDLKWQYNHSTDVGRFKIVRTLPMPIEKGECGFILWELETKEKFKGALRVGDLIQVWGPNDSSYWEHGERLMFIREYEDNGYNDCSAYLFANYKQVHWSCCEITGLNDSSEVQFETMINSEERGPDIPVAASTVYKHLRSYGR